MAQALEIILAEDVQGILDSFCACFGVRALFYSPEGGILTVGRTRPANAPYCRLLQESLFGVDRCLELDEAKRLEAARLGEPISYRCHGGLLETLMPLCSSDQLVGFAAIGQFRSAKAAPSRLRKAWAGRHSPEELDAAYEELPLISTRKVGAVLHLFSVLIDYIISHNMIARKGDLALQAIVSFIEANVDRPISLAEAASVIHRGKSSVSHLFRAKLGKSFKRTVIETKLAKAEEHMCAIPGITVAEVAYKVGYPDAFHFSSIYGRYRGFPPSEYLKRRGLK